MASNLISVVDDDESVRRTTKRLIESLAIKRQLMNLVKFC